MFSLLNIFFRCRSELRGAHNQKLQTTAWVN
jgi:hypothetical protein